MCVCSKPVDGKVCECVSCTLPAFLLQFEGRGKEEGKERKGKNYKNEIL